MRYFLLLLQLLTLPVSATADEEQIFADKALAAIFSEDDELYRSLLHPAMNQCFNRIWNKKTGNPPKDYGYDISEVTERTMSNSMAGARVVGLKDPSYPVMPTHQIVLSWTGEPEYPAGHPCFSEMQHRYPLTLLRDAAEWRIAAICITSAEADVLTEKQRQAAESNTERKLAADNLYSNLSPEQLIEFQELLLGNKVKAIYAYSEQLEVDLTTAYALRNMMCAEYSKTPSN